jgi:YVTN family beta-propeller protein
MFRRRKKLILAAAIFLLFMMVPLYLLHRWGQAHVLDKTGDERWLPNCFACHMSAGVKPAIGSRPNVRYRSPRSIAVSPDGKRLYITAAGDDRLLLVDAEKRRLLAEAPVGPSPHGVCLSADGKMAYVSNRWSSTVCVVAADTMKTVRTLKVGDGPAGLALSPDDATLFVANSLSNDISVVDVQSGLERRRLLAGRSPFGMTRSPDGRRIYVTNRLSDPVPFRTPPVVELTVLNTAQQDVAERKLFRNANMMEGIAVAPLDGGGSGKSLLLTTLVRPKNLLPGVQVARGWMMTDGLGIVELGSAPTPNAQRPTPIAPSECGDTQQILLDDLNAFYADPCDVVLTPDGRTAYVTHSGADVVSVVDVARMREALQEASMVTGNPCVRAYLSPANRLGLCRKFVTTRIRTAPCPTGLAVSPDGRFVYVAAQLADKIQVISTQRNVIVADIDLGGPREETLQRRGERLFKNSGHTFQGQFSCRSCHPDGHVDGLLYELESNGIGVNLVQNRPLQQISETSPFKWNGVSPSLYRQCGMRFAAFITRADPFSPDDDNALVAYIMTIPRYPNGHRNPDGTLTEAQKRGKAIFERAVDSKGNLIPKSNRCITCHPPPFYTDRKLHDVDTASPTDTIRKFDTPHLNNIYQKAPFLHDGKAATLEEIWTRYGTTEKHGAVNDLAKEQLNDLIRYLESL